MGRKNNIRIWYWDVLRIAAMVFLVIRHSSTATFEFVETLSINWWVCNIYGSLSAWMVPVFMMISGASFLDPNRNITIGRLYKRNILRMFIYFAFWSLFYAVYNIISGQGGKISFAEMLFTGHFHLWFLPMIMGMYMLTPLLRSVSDNKKYVLYITIASCIFGVLIPTLQDVGFFIDNSLITGLNNFGFVSAYVCFFFTGYFLHITEIPKALRLFIYSVAIIATVLIFFGTFLLTLKDGVHNEDIQSDNNFLTFVQGIAIFVFTKYYFANRKNRELKETTKSYVLNMSGLTFGVYMIHVVLLALLDKFGFSPVVYPAVYMIPMLIGFVLPLSFLLSMLIKKIPFIGKYII